MFDVMALRQLFVFDPSAQLPYTSDPESFIVDVYLRSTGGFTLLTLVIVQVLREPLIGP